MEAVVGHLAFLLHWVPEPLVDVLKALRVAVAVRKNEVELACRAGGFPLAQGVDDDRGEGNVARAGLRLRLANSSPGVGALPDVNNTFIKIYIRPGQAAQFAGAQARKHRHD